jgi:cystathionine beta-lyase
MKTDTRLVRFQSAPGDGFHALSTPLYQTATFAQPSCLEHGPYDYSRSGNPTRSVLERQLADLEGADRALCYASGLAAIAALLRVVATGGEVLAGDDLYGGTYRLLSRVLPGQGVTVRYVDASDPEKVAAAIGPSTRLLLIETPTNPLLRVVDIAALATVAHQSGALLAVDNSLLSPYRQRPLEWGADIVVHSATKALGGHSDLTAGVVAVRDPALAERLGFAQNAEGTALSPFEAWLLLRGLKTLGVRVERQEANAQRIAEFLDRQSSLRVHYPGLSSHPGAGLLRRQAEGSGSVISFETGSVDTSRRIVESLCLFTVSVSFGCVGSLVSLPCAMSHASIPAEVRKARALPEDLVRLAVGIEDTGDLMRDLEQALRRANVTCPRIPEAVTVKGVTRSAE